MNTHKALKEYLLSHNVRKLQLCCGDNYIDGWFNTDLIENNIKGIHQLDVTKPFDIMDDSFQFIYLEHAIEHITIKDAEKMLLECRRILSKDGIIRIATPDLKKFVDKFYLSDSKIADRYCKWITDTFMPYYSKKGFYSKSLVINNLYHNWGHELVYDFESLSLLLNDVGFRDIRLKNTGDSRHIELQNLESHYKHNDSNIDLYSLETMILEASIEKP